MYSVKVNDKNTYQIQNNAINDALQQIDLIEVKDGELHLIWNAKSYTAILVDANKEEKSMTVRINGNDYDVKVQDKYDILLQQLGMGNLKSAKINNIKAPMPGLVLRFEKKVGDEIKKGESVLILEAMKMENILKSPGEGKIKSILVKQGQAVEKNQILVELE